MRNWTKSILTAGVTGICAMFLFGVNGKAYIDPSVSSYIIQAVAGIIIAVAAVIGIYFRKVKKKINSKLGIDENRNKEVESNEILKKQQDDD